jgi:FkbM family methyltransferase
MSGTLSAIKQSLRYKFQLRFDADFRNRQRELSRLRSLPRYQATTTDLFLGTRLQLVDAASFLAQYDEIFESESYHFTANNETPYIIDGGANIGLSVLYIKRLYPNSEIVAFEPDDLVYRALEFNTKKLKNVTLIRRALWSSETEQDFFADGADAGRLAQRGDKIGYLVKTVRLADYLTRHVDLLKLDIEGAETEVLHDCEGLLVNVERIFVEYHSFPNRPQVLDRLLQILRNSGFRIDIYACGSPRRPFSARRNYLGMDLQLNIFAYRT